MTGELSYWVADWSLSRAHAALLLAGKGPIADMVDCTSASLPRVRQTSIRRFGAYITGSADIRWTAAELASVPHGSAVLRIDQSDSNLPLDADAKVAKDTEPGASTPVEAALVAGERLRSGRDYMIYVDRSELGAVEAAIAHQGLPPGQIVAFQYASPSSNPDTLLPGTNLTLKEANADLSVIVASRLPLPGDPPKHHPPAHHADPSPAHRHSLARAHIAGDGMIELDLRDMHWRSMSAGVRVTPLPWGDE